MKQGLFRGLELSVRQGQKDNISSIGCSGWERMQKRVWKKYRYRENIKNDP